MKFIKKNIVMLIALTAAIITSFIIPPDEKYFGYFDFKTLTCLFCVLAVVCALKNINFFYMLARKVVRLTKNARMSTLALVYITFIGSMLIANDMALLTFLPLGFIVLTATKQEKYMAFVFFFIFSGNMSRIESVNIFLSSLLEKSTLIVSALSCQVISNVPSAILLSEFTTNYKELLMGVNIGGTGTIIASLASLITFREYMSHNPGKAGKYLGKFSAFNFTFLGILLIFAKILLVYYFSF